MNLNIYLKFIIPSTCPLRPIMMDNASTLRFTAAAGTKLAGTYFPNTILFYSLAKKFYNDAHLHHSLSIAGSSLRSLSNFLHCCPNKVWVFLIPTVVDHPLRSTKDLRLGLAATLPTI